MQFCRRDFFPATARCVDVVLVAKAWLLLDRPLLSVQAPGEGHREDVNVGSIARGRDLTARDGDFEWEQANAFYLPRGASLA